MDFLWRFLERFWLTAGYIANIRKSISILYPQNRWQIERQTKLWVLKSFVVFAGIIIFMSCFGMQLYWFLASVIMSGCIVSVWRKGWSSKINVAITKELQSFINKISFAYRRNGELDEAFWQVLVEENGLMKMHGELIYENISCSNYEENYRNYKELAPNEFFLLFYALSHKVKEEGDTITNGSYQYTRNLMMLGREISNNINFMSKTKNAFSGLMGMCIFPVLFIRPIELWSVSNLPQLQNYFESTAGKMCSIAVLVISLLVLEIVSVLKYPDFRTERNNMITEKLSGNVWVTGFMNRRIYKRYGYYHGLWELLKRACSVENVVEFCITRYAYTLGFGVFFFVMSLGVGLAPWLTIAATLCGAACGYWYVYCMLYVRIFVIKSKVSDELVRLYTIAGMSRQQENMDVKGMLIQFELISVYFEPVFSHAVLSYEGDGSECLNELKEGLANKDAIRLVEGLAACDEFDVSEAMSFVDTELEYLIDAKHIRDEKSLSDRSALARFLSFIPFLTALLVKMIFPFIMEGLKELENFNEVIKLF